MVVAKHDLEEKKTADAQSTRLGSRGKGMMPKIKVVSNPLPSIVLDIDELEEGVDCDEAPHNDI